MNTENLLDQIRKTDWSANYQVNLDLFQISPFFQTIHTRLLENGWHPSFSDGFVPDYCKLNSDSPQSIEFTNAIALKKYKKDDNRLLTTGIKVTNAGVNFFWEQKLNPRLVKYLGIITLFILGLAVLFRWILPVTNYFPMLFFIIGISVNLFILFRAIYLFERHLQKDDGISLIFLESIVDFEYSKLDKNQKIICQ
jgi:hypothetical protein